jgi:transmembrane sensor
MDSEAIEEQAARWFVRRDRAVWTDADQAQFAAWLGERSAHRIAYLRLDTAWNHAARMKALGARVPSGVIPPRRSWGDTRFARGSWSASQSNEGASEGSPPLGKAKNMELIATSREKPRWASARLFVAAAAACLVVVLVAADVHTARFVSGGDRYITPVGGIDNVRLADGSQVTLNTDTSIRVILTAKERRVQLERGEAFFEVAKDKARPFIVYVGHKRVMAVGTQFAVRRNDSDIQVVVTEGRVSLAETRSPIYLQAGDIARTSKSEVLVRTNATSEAEKLLSWRRKYVVFDNTALADAVAEFNRYNTRKILIGDPAIAAIRIGGNFRATNTDGFIWLLQSGFPVSVERRDDTVVLRAR